MSLLDGKFLTMRLEDGESVVRLRGGRDKSLRWKSSRPHAGVWGEKTSYVLVPCRTRRAVNIRAKMALSSVPSLRDQSSADEVLLIGAHEDVEALVTNGPTWCRALPSRKGQPRSTAQEAAFIRLRSQP